MLLWQPCQLFWTMLHSDTDSGISDSIISVFVCGRVGAAWRGRTVTNLTQAGGHRPLTGLSEQRAAFTSTSANSLIITADSTFDDKDGTTVKEKQGFKENVKGKKFRLFLRLCVSYQITVPQQTRSSRVNYSFHFCLFHRIQFSSCHTWRLYPRSQPASTNQALIDPFALLFSV